MAGFFDTLFGGGAEAEAADKNRALLGAALPQQQGYLQTGYNTGTQDLNQAIGAYSPLSALAGKYGAGTDLYLNALGVNGPQAAQQAQSQFTTTPGFQLSQKAGLDAVNQRRALGGMMTSGNADQDAINYSQNNIYQNQYQPWMQGLSGINQNNIATTGAAAAGQAAGYGSLANLATGYGQDQTSLLNNYNSGMMNANNTQAAGEAAGAKNAMSAALGIGSALLTGGGSLGFGGTAAGMGLNKLFGS
jgi:hypothetical protein